MRSTGEVYSRRYCIDYCVWTVCISVRCICSMTCARAQRKKKSSRGPLCQIMSVPRALLSNSSRVGCLSKNGGASGP